jgi:hypothetical protein
MLQLLLYSGELNSHCQASARQLRQLEQAELIQKRNRYASACIAFMLLRCSCKTNGITCYCSSPLGWGDISIARTLYKNFFLLPQASFSILKIIDKNRCKFLATDPEARVRFPALPKKKSIGSATGSTQPREYN